jgi:hypothetical protein
MPYLNCPSCGLILTINRPGDLVEHCPRCLARGRRLVDLYVSSRPRGRQSAAPPDRQCAAGPGRSVEERP